MKPLHPENKCAQLFKDDLDISNITLDSMFEMQAEFQKKISGANAIKKNTLFEDGQELRMHVYYLIEELVELMQRAPHKPWSKKHRETKEWESEDDKIETWYEYIDAWHFFMNIGIILGVTPEIFKKLYVSKHKENKDRQKRGY